MDRNPHKGFTLIELVVAMAVAAVLVGVAVPSFTSAIKNNRLQSQTRELQMALLKARSEAVKGRDDMTICARATDATCGTDWDNGWLVFIDRVIVTTEAVPVPESVDDILRIAMATPTGIEISAKGSVDRTAAGVTSRDYIRYDAFGRTDWTNGTFTVCDDRGNTHAKSLNIALTGDIRPGRSGSDDEIPHDAFNTDVDC
ncbi:MAG: GspH/FimT family protein [Granulosicoccus sp.]